VASMEARTLAMAPARRSASEPFRW
jgi:hypothetical protein